MREVLDRGEGVSDVNTISSVLPQSQKTLAHPAPSTNYINMPTVLVTRPTVTQLMEFHLTATECHLPYGIPQHYLPPDTSEHC